MMLLTQDVDVGYTRRCSGVSRGEGRSLAAWVPVYGVGNVDSCDS